MKRIYKYILPAAVAVLVLTGCQNEDFDPAEGSVTPSFSATVKGEQSRAIDSAWESGDKIGINYSYSANYPKNKCYVTHDGNGEFIPDSPGEQIYYMSTSLSGSVTFYAYYPWTSGTTISFDTSDQSNQRTFDFLTAKGTGSKANPKVNLEFEHKMSKLTFVFKSGNEDVRNIDRFSIGDLYIKGTLSMPSSDISSSSISVKATTSNTTKEAVTMEVSELKDGEPAPSLILIPQSIATMNLKIHCRNELTPETELTFPGNQLLAGTHYKCTITVNKGALTVNECTIENWKDYKWPEGGGTGSANSADYPDE